MAWTDERRDLAAKMWNEGCSATEIARKLGGVSRNAVIGVIHRKGLSTRTQVSKPRRVVYKAPPVARAPSQNNGLAFKTRTRMPSGVMVLPPLLGGNGLGAAAAMANAAARAVPLPPSDDKPGLRTILTIRAFECRWPIGDPQADDFTLCGVGGCVGPYCVDHTERAAATPGATKRLDKRLGIAGMTGRAA